METFPSSDSLELNFGPGKAEALRLGRDLETAFVALHDVVIADAAFVNETAGAIELVSRSWKVPHKRSMRPFACGLWAAT